MTSTVTSKGQITLPAEIRKRLNLQPGDKLDFIVREDGTIEVHPEKCEGCGVCEQRCPFDLPIRQMVRSARQFKQPAAAA